MGKGMGKLMHQFHYHKMIHKMLPCNTEYTKYIIIFYESSAEIQSYCYILSSVLFFMINGKTLAGPHTSQANQTPCGVTENQCE